MISNARQAVSGLFGQAADQARAQNQHNRLLVGRLAEIW